MGDIVVGIFAVLTKLTGGLDVRREKDGFRKAKHCTGHDMMEVTAKIGS